MLRLLNDIGHAVATAKLFLAHRGGEDEVSGAGKESVLSVE